MSLKSRIMAIEKALPKACEIAGLMLTPEARKERLDWYKGLIGEERFNMMVKEFNQIPYQDNEKKLEVIRKYYQEI